MKCKYCGIENKKSAKFCTSCGKPLNESPEPTGGNSKLIIIALIAIIIILVGTIGFFVLNNNFNSHDSEIPNNTVSSQESNSANIQDSDNGGDVKTQVTSSQTTNSKSWEPIGSYSGSGSGSKTITVPEGKIKVEFSAYPIKNYATNYLTVSGSNGESGGVDWGSHSAVKTKSDSFIYTSSSSETFTIDYYETVSWEVHFYRYQ
ncbi:hypothetical protein SAMN05216439_0989 [Methanobrevibacter gottschalkii]|uniref:Zinc-ribbon domain-containing protein n=2 Tax=Methanobrevibacter gottschalkii TaxID=190974 RepID=A0A3N5B5K6_9EURY|nr:MULTISPECIES: zinc ribbon domain-containing protein [Methanobrevibacter]MCQ2971347.1 zinc ribbon domain-containing protein [archaeon]OED00632.1 hypothetical protein A9505_02910 [Methanobrevibacter sp. A27]RPF50830.1 hypothetical protein EDC42_1487 [Methanobrevibacter gottschalkii DSM 11977]SEK46321.1 hypothetical protein SAMN05216439_0989 [Methanobrevibacter gottschalkii]